MATKKHADDERGKARKGVDFVKEEKGIHKRFDPLKRSPAVIHTVFS